MLEETNDSNEDIIEPSAFDKDTDIENMTDEEVEELAKAESEEVKTVALDCVNSAGVIYQVMPENYKMELLDTKHPNANMPEFINWLAGRSAAPFGLTREFATFTPTGADYRANQLFTERVFEECQKWLENICDWTLYRWTLWANKRGIIKRTPDTFIYDVDWSWPKMEELDENAHQDAVEKKLRNMTSSYRDELGPDWKDTLMTVKDEIDWCKQNNLPHPAY